MSSISSSNSGGGIENLETVFNFSTWPPIQFLPTFPLFLLEAPPKTERGAPFLTSIFFHFPTRVLDVQ